MKKHGVLALIVFLSFISIVSADTNQTDENKVTLAYQCLENGVNSSSPSLEESIFAILALGSNNKVEQKIENEKSSSGNTTCWPKQGCRVKDTAQALLSYRQIGKNTDAIENYLISKKSPTTGLNWFLEIDIQDHVAADCTLKYAGNERTINIGADMKLSGDPGSCLSIVSSGYWLEISQSCLDRSFEVSCTQNFVTALLYKKEGSDTLFISPNTHSATSPSSTNETINSRCFKTSSGCDYEGSLWAALALNQESVDISPFIPYLVAFAQDNQQLFPSAFLYKLTNGQDYFSSLAQSQSANNYWQLSNNRFYDTAIGLLALQGKQVVELDKAKTYLLNVQGSNGCWNNNNLRDTAFLLYAGWPDASRIQSTTGGNGSQGESCESASAQYNCESSEYACVQAGGQALRNYECSSSLICCSIAIPRQTCSQQSGELCSANEECLGTIVEAVDGRCCVQGACQARTQEQNQCENVGGSCRSSCDSDVEDESTESCPISGDVCCIAKETPVKSSSSWTTWVIVLLVLIVLVVLAIVFRRKIQFMLFKARKSGTSSSPVSLRRFPPSSPPPGAYRPHPASSLRKPMSQLDKEMEDTLHKLRDITK